MGMDVISMARSKLILEQPFFGTLAIYLTPIKDEDTQTAATDGRSLFYNPAWIEEIRKEYGIDAVMGAIAHEVLHCALGHIWRRGTREHRLWNFACDFAANLIIRDAGLKLPDGALYSEKFRGMSAEDIYAELQKGGLSSSAGMTIDDHSRWGKVSAAEALGSSGKENLQDMWSERLVTAAQACRQQGKLPASLERLVKQLIEPKINYRQLLAEYMQKIENDYVWGPFDRRHIYCGTYLPAKAGEGLHEVVVAIDTSGSVDENEIAQFLAETFAIASIGIVRLHVVSCDAKIHEWVTAENMEIPVVKPRGGGGTDFVPVFEEVKRRNIEPSLLIYLTDGYGVYPKTAPSYPVLWVLTKDHREPPFGRTVVLD